MMERLQQGYTLLTPITKRWSGDQWDKNEYEERRRIFTGFTPEDSGRSRKLVCVCETPEQARALLDIHQAALAAKDQQVQAWEMAYEGVQRQLAAKDQELELVKEERDEYHALNEHHKDAFLTANLKLARVMQAHDTLLSEAVWAMQRIKFEEDWPDEPDYQRAAAFLARPDVQEWLEKDKKEPDETA